MIEKKQKFTDEQMATINAEYSQMLAKLEQQNAEQCAFLANEINKDTLLTAEQRTRLVTIVEDGGFKLRAFNLTDANVDRRLSVQVTYDVHDELADYLWVMDDKLPVKLRGFLRGGVDITDLQGKDAAIDKSPLTGKTKTGVAEYDRMMGKS